MEPVDWNEYVKIVARILIFLFILVGLAFVGYGLYIVFLPWGGAERAFYEACGICLVLFGSGFATISIFGFMAVDNQIMSFGKYQYCT